MARGEHREAAMLFRRVLTVHPRLDAARENLRAALGEVLKYNERTVPTHRQEDVTR